MWNLPFCDQLIWLNVMPASFIRVVYGRVSSLCWIICMIYKYHIFLIHSPINWQLDFIYLLAIVNNAAMNMVVQISLWDPVFNSLGYLDMRLLYYSGVLFFNFGGIYIPFFVAAAPFTLLPTCVPTACRSLSPPHSLQPLFFCIILIVFILLGMRSVWFSVAFL